MFIHEEGLLGGPGDAFLSAADLQDLQVTIREIARAKGHDWSLMYALVDPEMQVTRYLREGTGEVRYFGELELAEQEQPQQWKRDAIIETREGISGNEAKQLRLVAIRPQTLRLSRSN